MQRIDFVVNGPPIAWHRPEQTKTGHTFKNKLDKEFQKAIANSASAAIARAYYGSRNTWKLDSEFHVHATFYVKDLVRRDIDNLEKNILDGMNGIVWNDDSQVVKVTKEKRLDRARPRVDVTVEKVIGFMAELEGSATMAF